MERVVQTQTQLQRHLYSNSLMPPLQSAYRAYHSTETALLKTFNDVLLAADKGEITALCMLDLTAVRVRIGNLIGGAAGAHISMTLYE